MIKVILNKKFYPEKAVKQTIQDYTEICDVKIENDELTLIPKKEVDLQQLKNEFCNYCLSLVK